jgi:hypothetical protein
VVLVLDNPIEPYEYELVYDLLVIKHGEGTRTANAFRTFVTMKLMGKTFVKTIMDVHTYYTHLKMLKAVGVHA